MNAVTIALDEASRTCPGWVVAVLAKALSGLPAPQAVHAATAKPIETLEQAWAWAQNRLPVQLQVGDRDVDIVSQATLKTAVRSFCDASERGPLLKAQGESVVLSKDVRREVTSVVPSTGPTRPLVAFIGLQPTDTDAARGEPFSGQDGAFFTEHYLTPLGLAKADVLLTHCMPVAGQLPAEEMVQYAGFAKRELESHKPLVVVALGSVAKQHLGEAAQFVLPHPAAVRRAGDTSHVTRKLKAVRARIEELQAAEAATRKGIVVGAVKADAAQVHIAKALEDKQIVIGVVLDGYQFDSQGDWVPPSEIEKTAHDWMENSRVVGLQHAAPADAVVVESWLWPYPSSDDYRAAMAGEPHQAYASTFGDQVVHSGSWLIGVKIKDDATWAAVQAGLITAYSIGGDGLQRPTTPSAMPAVTFIAA